MLVAIAIGSTLMAALAIAAMCCTCPDPPEQPSPEQTQRAALAALAAAVPVPPPSSTGRPVAELPCYPYAAAQGSCRVCAICLETLLPGELCSEVPACGHVFHGNCVAAWARSKGSCPLCRAAIVPGTDRVAVADDMV